MRFEILGPLRVRTADREVAVTAGRERAVLAMLLLHPGRTVPVEQLVAAVWPDSPPRSARNQVQACVSLLRKPFAGAGHGDVVVTDPVGYRLRIDPSQVDAYEFRTLVTGARAAAAAGRPRESAEAYRAADALWRGPALAGIDAEPVRHAAAALDEERVQAQAERFEAELAAGASGELVAELTELVRQHPYREGLYATLVRALYRAGRPAEALAELRRARDLFRAELGTDPGEELRRLYRAVLHRDPALAAPDAAVPAVRELPGEASCFVGRDDEVTRVRAMLLPAGRESRRRPAVVVVYGPGGIGKSALAVRVGHELAAEFPDGQLYVDLCGSTPGMRPLTGAEVLGRFLRRLGEPPDHIPTDEAEAAALFRSLTADRRLLVMLDNAAGKEQVAPLLPGSPACGVMVTSRQPLPSLDADHRVRLGVLPEPDGLALLGTMVEGAAVDAESARRIVALCGGLPLAIRIAAGRLATRPGLSAAEYAARLADDSRRLDELRLDDLAVRVSLRASYDALADGDLVGELAARAFRMLGVLHVPDVAPGVVAAMLDEPDVETVRAALDRLADAQLVEPLPQGRYRLHDLVRLLATETAADHHDERDRHEAIHRALVYYGNVLQRVAALMRPGAVWMPQSPPPPAAVAMPALEDAEAARAWIDAELPSLVAALDQVAQASQAPPWPPLWVFELTWHRLYYQSEWQAALRLGQLALRIGRQHGDDEVTGWGYLALGRSQANLGDYHGASINLEAALRAMHGMEYPEGTVTILNSLGVAATWSGRLEASLGYYEQAMVLAQRHRLDKAKALLFSNMSNSYIPLGKVDEAVNAAAQSAAISREQHAPDRLASSLHNLAAAKTLRGEYLEAVQYANDAVVCALEIGNPLTEREARLTRSVANLWRGNDVEAGRDAQYVLESARAGNDRYAEAAALRQRAHVLAAAGDISEAAEARAQAEAAYEKLRSRREPVIEMLLQDYEAAHPALQPPAVTLQRE